MGLPRGRRWVDRPGKRWPVPVLSKMQEAVRAGFEPTEAINDPIAERDRLHASAVACARRQGELPLAGSPSSDHDA